MEKIIGIGVVLMLVLVISGCEYPYYNTFQLSNGDVVECQKYSISEATINLHNCKDGKSYLGQLDVIKINGN